MTHSVPCRIYLLLILLAGNLSAQSIPAKDGWLEVTQEELDVSAPRVDSNAGAELLLRHVRVHDNDPRATRFKYYIRAKIFSKAGIEDFKKIEIPYSTGWKVEDLRARVINPDGSITEIQRKDVFRKEIVKVDRFEGYAKAFALPGLQVGSIVEYRWTHVRSYFEAGLHISMRDKWPTWNFKAEFETFRGLASLVRFYNSVVKMDREKGNIVVRIKDQPAIVEKPHLAARLDFEPFLALVYSDDVKKFKGDLYWGYRGGSIVKGNRTFIKPKLKQVKSVAKEIFDGLGSREEKLAAAYDFCRKSIVNISEYTEVYTEEELEKLDSNESPAQTLSRGYGTRFDINMVFASLCQSQGIDAYLSNVENRHVFSFQHLAIGSFNLSDWLVAVRDGGTWRFFDPGTSDLPMGTLNPENGGAQAIVADKKFYYMTETKDLLPEESLVKRTARVSLDEFGDLSASVRITFSGYSGIEMRRLLRNKGMGERKRFYEENLWQARLPRAQVKDITFDKLESLDEDLVVRFDLSIAAYGDVLGNRIIFNPCLFQAGWLNPFSEEERSEPIAFEYPVEIRDSIEISLPDGYRIEDSSSLEKEFENKLLSRSSSFESEGGVPVYERQFKRTKRFIYGHDYGTAKTAFDTFVAADAAMLGLVKE